MSKSKLAEPDRSSSVDAKDRDKIDARLEKARIDLLDSVTSLRAGTLSTKEADAVEAAIEDELIALRVGLLCGRA